MRKKTLPLTFLLFWLLVNCAGSKSSHRSQTRFDFGRSPTVSTLRGAVGSTLSKYNHELNVLGSFMETEWRHLPPSEEQEMSGIREVRYKLTVNFRNRRNLSYADAILQYEGRYETGDWTDLQPNQDIVEFVQNMQGEIKQLLQRYISQQ